MEQAINILFNENVNIVAASMNSESNVSSVAPANCPHVVSVAAVGPTKKLTYYSDYGAVTISAPGGDDTIPGGQIYSTICLDKRNNTGCNFYNTSNFGWTYMNGTSMAAPHVSAAVADLLSKNPNLKVNQIISILQASATTFIKGNNCNAKCCVQNGMLNANAALKYHQ